MIEPTESESKEECDLFIDAMKAIAEEAATKPEIVKTAPHTTRVRRLDEVGAARKPILRWKAAVHAAKPRTEQRGRPSNRHASAQDSLQAHIHFAARPSWLALC